MHATLGATVTPMSRVRVLAAIVFVVAAAMASLLVSGLVSGQEGSGSVAYRGLSAQRLPVVLQVAKDRKSLTLDVKWATRCGDDIYYGGVMRTVRRQRVSIARDGAFAWKGVHVVMADTYDDRLPARLSGHVGSDGTISGSWRVGPANARSSACRSVDTTFRVRRRGSLRPPAPRADRSGNLVVALDGRPMEVAVGAGRTWVLGDSRTGRLGVTEIDPRTGRAGARTRVPEGNLAAGEGAVWQATVLNRRRRDGGVGSVSGERRRVRVARIDPRTRRVRLVPRRLRNAEAAGNADLAVGAGGVWLLNGEFVERVAPRTGRIEGAVRLPTEPRVRTRPECHDETDAELIAIGRGAVWVASRTSYVCGPGMWTYRLSRIDPPTNRVTLSVPLHRRYVALAVGRGGVWAATYGDRRPALHRIGLRDGRPAAGIRLPAGHVSGIGIGRSGIWVGQGDQLGGALRRVDPARRRVSTVRRLEGGPSNVVVDEAGAWVVDTGARALIRAWP